MQKIISLFKRDATNPKNVIDVVTEGAEWVIAGEGKPTRKWDGTCCAIIGGKFYKRMDWDAGKGPAPAVWLHWDFNPEQRSGHGWYPVGEGPEDWAHREAFARGSDHEEEPFRDGTYELCGPRINRGPENTASNWLIPHGRDVLEDCERTYEGIKSFLSGQNIEGIVWHRGNGDMVKIKGKDFGIKRKAIQLEPAANPWRTTSE